MSIFKLRENFPDNKGIKVRVFFGKVFYFFPSMKIKQINFYRKSNLEDKIEEYDIIYLKIFLWWWFRISLIVESVGERLKDMKQPTEVFFDMLPPSINIVGEVYNLKIEKNDFVTIFYEKKDDSKKILMKRKVIRKDLKNAAKDMVNYLKISDNVRFMKHEYIKKYEDYFKIEVPQERKFEPYYE